MSLTNDMLKNLEKNNRISDHNAALFDGLAPAPSNKLYYAICSALVVFVLCLCAETFYYFDHHEYGVETVVPRPVLKSPPLSVFIQQHNAEMAAKALIQPVVTTAAPPLAPIKPAVANLTAAPVAEVGVPVKTPESAGSSLDASYQDALSLLEQNQEPAAIEKLNDILNRNPEYTHARITLATIYLEHNNLETATNILSEGVQLQPQNIDLNLLLARTMVSAGHSQKALHVLNNIATVDAADPFYLELLAEINQSLGNDEKAISLYQNLLEQDPSNARWIVGLAISYEHDHQIPQALDAYQKANASPQLSPELQSFVAKRISQLNAK